jgi:hypothetical protein
MKTEFFGDEFHQQFFQNTFQHLVRPYWPGYGPEYLPFVRYLPKVRLIAEPFPELSRI